jgi:peptidyl-prolyl cis-trans isomerase D
MALIGKIRERSGLVLTLIALAVIGFVVMDMTKGGPGGNASIFSNPNVMGSVAGTKVNRQDFAKMQDVLYGGNGDIGASNQVWNYFVEEALVSKEASCLGLGISDEELEDLLYSPDPAKLSPVIQQMFMNRSTGAIDMQQLQQYKEAMEDPNYGADKLQAEQLAEIAKARLKWNDQKKMVIKERLQAKFNAMMSKANYAPTWMAEMMFADQNNKTDALAVNVPFGAVQDNEVQVSDADYKAYIDNNKGLFYRLKEGRKVSYATFMVAPTAKDSQDIVANLAKLIPEFKTSKSDTNFIASNDGKLEATYFMKSEMGKQAADSLFSKPVGAVVGPYLDGNSYRIAKILSRKVIADSVRARHVLFQAESPKVIDSLFAAVKNGKMSWDSLNKKSTDKVSAAKGGDLGYFSHRMMVKEFSDLCFYKAEQGKYYKVNTQFGTHIIQVTGVKNIKNESGVQLAYISNDIVPSDDTQQKAKDAASAIAQKCKTLEALKEAAKTQNIQLATSAPLNPDAYQVDALGANAQSMDIVRWAYKSKAGQVAPKVYDFSGDKKYTDKYVVVALKSVLPAGLPSVEDVKEDIESSVKNQKKAELIKGKLAGKDLSGALSTFANTRIDTLRQINFAGQNYDPKLIGNIAVTAQGATTQPVIARNGVMIAQVLNKAESPAPADLSQIQKQLMNSNRSQIRSRLLQTMKDEAKIEDKRNDYSN